MSAFARMLLVGALLLPALPISVAGADTIPKAYRDEGLRAGVPAEVLYGIALTESRRKTPSGAARPWPWTLNVEGKAYFYDSRSEALRGLRDHLARTERIDVGVMQIHWRFHKERFGSDPLRALDPYVNLQAGAAILREYWRETGALWKAVGRYHSGTPQYAASYRLRFAENLTNLLVAAPPGLAPPELASPGRTPDIVPVAAVDRAAEEPIGQGVPQRELASRW